MAFHFFIPECHFQSERCRFGVNTMCTPHHDGVFVFDRFIFQDIDKMVQIFTNNVVCLFQQIGLCGVDNVCRGEPVMYPLAFISQRFGDRSGKGDHIMSCFLFDFLNPLNMKRSVPAYFLHIISRNNAQFAPCFTCEEFHLQPCIVFVFLAPDRTHFFPGISFNHCFASSYTASCFFASSNVSAINVIWPIFRLGLTASLPYKCRKQCCLSGSIFKAVPASSPKILTVTAGLSSSIGRSCKPQMAQICCSNCDRLHASIV